MHYKKITKQKEEYRRRHSGWLTQQRLAVLASFHSRWREEEGPARPAKNRNLPSCILHCPHLHRLQLELPEKLLTEGETAKEEIK